MKKIIFFITPLAFCYAIAFSQGCLPEGIAFTTQSQIDSFQINYPGCTQIEGDVRIAGLDITNLNGLNVLTSIGGELHIGACSYLSSLSGLNSLSSVGGKLMINDTPLSDLTGLNGLTTISGDFEIIYMQGLITLTGLESLTTVGGTLSIASSSQLANLDPLASLTSIGGSFGLEALFSLQNVTGLGALASIGGNAYFTAIGVTDLMGLNALTFIGGALVIQNNHGLSSLSGLDQIEAASVTGLTIIQNDTLKTCAIQSVCDYLASPGAIVEIHDNASGCNSLEEVQMVCDTLGVNESTGRHSAFNVRCSPNPFLSVVTVEYQLGEAGGVTLSFFNSMGRKVGILVNEHQSKGIHHVTWNAEAFPSGIYFYRMQAGHEVGSGKIVKW